MHAVGVGCGGKSEELLRRNVLEWWAGCSAHAAEWHLGYLPLVGLGLLKFIGLI